MTPTVRPWIRWALRVVLPVLILIGAWQVWGRYETMRLEQVSVPYQEARNRIDAEAALPSVNPGTVSPYRYYAAAADLADPQETPPFRWSIEAMRASIAAGQPVEAAVANQATAKLDRHREALALVEAGAGLPVTGNDAIFRRLRSMNALSELMPVLSLRTLHAAAADDGDAAAHSVTTALRLAHALALDAHSFVAAEKAAFMPAVVADTTVVLQRTRPSDAALEQLAGAFSALFRDNDLERLTTTQAGTFYGAFVTQRNPLDRHLGRLVMQTSVKAIAVARKPWPERVNGMKELPDWTFPALNRNYRFMNGERLRELYSSSASMHAEGVALAHAALVAVRLEQYRRKTGELPDSLASLALPPQDALDPFTGKALRYRKRDDNVVVYSVGRDGRDDGGSLERQKGMIARLGRSKDIGVSVSPPPR